MTLFAIRFSDGAYGRLVPKDVAERAFDSIDPERRALCEVTEWQEVTGGERETMRPEASAPEPIDLNCRHCGQEERAHGHAGRFRPCPPQGLCYEPINPPKREPMVTVDESEGR